MKQCFGILICISLIANNIRHLHVCSLAIYIVCLSSSWVKLIYFEIIITTGRLWMIEICSYLSSFIFHSPNNLLEWSFAWLCKCTALWHPCCKYKVPNISIFFDQLLSIVSSESTLNFWIKAYWIFKIHSWVLSQMLCS
jgi:hypothetical protein